MRRLLSLVLVLLATPVFAQVDTNTPTRDEMAAAISGVSGSQNAQTSFLVSGGQVAWTADYDFTVSAATYYILGAPYSSAADDISLSAAHATLDRIDVIAVNDSGAVVVVEGTAAAQPSEPDIDPGTQLKLAIVLVTANTTEPTTIASTTVYADNAGSPTEWNCTTSGSGFNCNSTNNPRSPSTKDIEGTNVASGAYAQLQIGSGTFDPSTRSLLVLYIRSKAAWANKRGLTISLRSTGVLVGTSVDIVRSGTFGFDSSQTSTYQQVAIPLEQFAVPAGSTINQVRITDFGGAIGFYIDDISFQGGASQQVPVGITQSQADGRYLKLPVAGYFWCQALGGGDVLPTGTQSCYVKAPFALTITGWTVLSNSATPVSGNITWDVWVDSATYPPTNADSITAAAKPLISNATNNTSTAVSTWTTSVSAGAWIGFEIESVTDITDSLVQIFYQRVQP